MKKKLGIFILVLLCLPFVLAQQLVFLSPTPANDTESETPGFSVLINNTNNNYPNATLYFYDEDGLISGTVLYNNPYSTTVFITPHETYTSQTYTYNATSRNLTNNDTQKVADLPLNNTNYATNVTFSYSNPLYNGTLTGYTFSHGARTGGQSGSNFNGSQYVNFSYNPYINKSKTFSVSAWVKINNLSQAINVIYTNVFTAIGNDVFLLTHENSSIKVGVYNGSSWVANRNTTVTSTSTWYNIVYVYNGDQTGYLFVNNVNATGTNNPSGVLNNGTSLGRRSDAGGYFNGNISTFRVWNRALTTSEIASEYSTDKNTPTSIGNGLVAQYILDSSYSQFNNASLVYDTNNLVQGRNNSLISTNFNKNTTYIYLGNNTFDSLGFTSGYSVNMWFKPNSNTSTQELFDFEGRIGYATVSNGGIKFNLQNTSGTNFFVEPTNKIVVNEWQFYSFIYNGSHILVYVNGVTGSGTYFEKVNGTIDTTQNRPNNIGISYALAGVSAWNGSISDVRIYNRSLSAEEVYYLYSNGVPQYTTLINTETRTYTYTRESPCDSGVNKVLANTVILMFLLALLGFIIYGLYVGIDFRILIGAGVILIFLMMMLPLINGVVKATCLT